MFVRIQNKGRSRRPAVTVPAARQVRAEPIRKGAEAKLELAEPDQAIAAILQTLRNDLKFAESPTVYDHGRTANKFGFFTGKKCDHSGDVLRRAQHTSVNFFQP